MNEFTYRSHLFVICLLSAESGDAIVVAHVVLLPHLARLKQMGVLLEPGTPKSETYLKFTLERSGTKILFWYGEFLMGEV